MQAIHRTKKRSVQVACDVLSTFIRNRLLPAVSVDDDVKKANQTRLEKACITFVLFAVNITEDVSKTASTVQLLLDSITTNGSSILSAKAVHAMQTLIWKASGSSHRSTTGVWLQLLRHPAFEGGGQVNKAKIGRYVRRLPMDSLS